MEKFLSEIVENHKSDRYTREIYQFEDIEITVLQNGDKIVVWGFNYKSQRFLNLGSKKYSKLITGFKGIAKELYSKDGKYYVIIKAEPAWTQPQRLKHQQPSIHEYIKEISETPANQAVSEKDMESIYEQYGKYLIETKNPVLKEYLEKEITKKESIATELKQSIKEIESEELSGKERGNIAKRQRRYQEIQKEIRDMRKAIG
jgi:hypothetical protein